LDDVNKLIKERGLKLGWIAEQIGCSRQNLHKVLHQGRQLKPDKLKKLYEVLGIEEE
jgi:antitoxin component HigA of HigAB toxin-antitoxin module